MGEAMPNHRRTLEPRLRGQLDRSPVVVLTGARQTGKTTLARELSAGDARVYLTLDHLPTLSRARAEPEVLVESDRPLAIDEVQRAPDLLLAVKHAVDLDRRPGRFLLTGSANLLLMRSTGDSLAGRATYSTLRGLTPREQRDAPDPSAWTRLLEARDAAGALATIGPRASIDWREFALRGGFPPAALAATQRERREWLEGYASTYVSRDVRELAQVDDLAGFGRLLHLIALRTGGVLNHANLARDAALPRTTVQRWISLLVASYLVDLVPPCFEARSKRFTKAPKLYLSDSGLALHLASIEDVESLERHPSRGVMLETLVLNDLLVWAEMQGPRATVLHYRTVRGLEVDFVIEHARRWLPIEVKAGRAVRSEDARAVEAVCREHADRAPFGVVLYDGDEPLRLSEHTAAMPIRCML